MKKKISNKSVFSIALIGNMNNNAFALQRYLLDKGYSVDLFYFETEHSHFRPEKDSFDSSRLQSVRPLHWTKDNWVRTSKDSIKGLFQGYNFIICQGVSPAFFYKAGIKPQVFMPYGGDIYNIPFYIPHNKLKTFVAKVKRWIFGKGFVLPKEQFSMADIKGIQSCKHVILFNNEWEWLIAKLNLAEKWRRIPIPMSYVKDYDVSNNEVPEIAQDITDLRAKFDFLAISHARQYWCDHNRPSIDSVSTKGNDILIQGFARYLQTTNRRNVLILFEYGIDVAESKKLIQDLGIEDNVYWLPTLPRKKIMLYLRNCDLVCNEFVNSWLGGGVIFEALSMGKPLMGYRDDKLYEGKDLYPMYNVNSVESVLNAFMDLENSPEKAKNVGIEGRDWYKKNIVDVSMDFFARVFHEEMIEQGLN